MFLDEEATPEKMQPEEELSVGTSLPYLGGQLVTWLGLKSVRKRLARVPTLPQGLPWVRDTVWPTSTFLRPCLSSTDMSHRIPSRKVGEPSDTWESHRVPVSKNRTQEIKSGLSGVCSS